MMIIKCVLCILIIILMLHLGMAICKKIQDKMDCLFIGFVFGGLTQFFMLVISYILK